MIIFLQEIISFCVYIKVNYKKNYPYGLFIRNKGFLMT